MLCRGGPQAPALGSHNPCSLAQPICAAHLPNLNIPPKGLNVTCGVFHCYSRCLGGPTQAERRLGKGSSASIPAAPSSDQPWPQTSPPSPAVETCTSAQKNELAGSKLAARTSQSGAQSTSPTSRDKGRCQRPVPQTAGWEQ